MNFQKIYKIVISLVLVMLSSFCSAEEPPKKIISLAPSITENLYLLGAEASLVAVTSYCNYPPQANDKESIGTLFNPNIEKIYSLSPDLVLAVKGVNRPRTLQKLKSLGIRVVTFKKCNSFNDIKNGFIQLGMLVGAEEKAKRIVEHVNTEVEILTSKFRGYPPLKVFCEVGARPLITISEKSFANEYVWRSGGLNIFRNMPAGYPRVSREEVLRKDPDIILLVLMGNVTVGEKTGEKIYWQKFKDLCAAKSGRIYIVNPDSFCRPTPLTFLKGLKEVAAILHPE